MKVPSNETPSDPPLPSTAPSRLRQFFLVIIFLCAGNICQAEDNNYWPQIHGILRGKYEYEPNLRASRFEVRNARISVEGSLPLRSCYKVEVDLCDETEIKLKDAWVGIIPWSTLKVSIGQQRMPFSIDAHRNPAEQYFANRSFIAKQVGDMRDVGLLASYTFNNNAQRPIATLSAGIFNGASITSQQTAWHSDWNYSARLQFYPIAGLAIVPSIQHTAIADRAVHYTSLDIGAYYERKGWHAEAEYLHKFYSDDAFEGCNAIDAILIYRMPFRSNKGFFEALSYMCRYDYMGDHTDGKSGFDEDNPRKLIITDYERHRFTLGITLSIRNKYFPTDLRFNYEKYHYPHGGAKESERDKIVAELAIKF